MTPDRIRSIRTRAEMSQEEFARTLGVSKQTVWRWESGRRTPNEWYVATLEQLEKQLDEKEKKGQKDEFIQAILGIGIGIGIAALLDKLFGS